VGVARGEDQGAGHARVEQTAHPNERQPHQTVRRRFALNLLRKNHHRRCRRRRRQCHRWRCNQHRGIPSFKVKSLLVIVVVEIVVERWRTSDKQPFSTTANSGNQGTQNYNNNNKRRTTIT